jgi:hypothetical protein
MISGTNKSMMYIALTVSAAYILSIGSVYGQANQTAQTPQDVRGPILAKALESLNMAKQAYDAGNTTGALDEAHAAILYLQMIDLPKNCLLDNNQMLQCNFPG